MKITEWRGCYQNQWRGLIVPEAYSHPAKFAPGLIQRIYKHMLEQGYILPGDLVGDCFGGIGGGGIFAAFAGLSWVGCELEPKFVALAQENFDLHRATWQAHGWPEPVILQGDSRRFAEIVGRCGAVLTSPPFVEQQTGGGIAKHNGKNGNIKTGINCGYQGQGKTPGQVGALKAGDLAAVVSSPPYAEGLSKEHTYSDHGKRLAGVRRNIYSEKGISDPFYGQTSGQLGKMKAGNLDAVVSSPPFESSLDNGTVTKAERVKYAREHGISNAEFVSPIDIEHARQDGYGGTAGQIGQQSGETYWQAVSEIYQQCHQALKPGGYMAIVVKAYVKNKRRVPLPMQTLRLLIHLGFEPVERIKAMLVSEPVVQNGLFGEDTVHQKQRKSFFRRLAEKKGSPRIDWEEVLIVRKP